MTVKPCRECGKDVSQMAKACPHCGIPHPANKVADAGSKLMAVGCLLTVFVTIPIVLLFLLL